MRVSVFIDSMISSVLADFKAILAPLVGLAFKLDFAMVAFTRTVVEQLRVKDMFILFYVVK